jgi:sugar (pentulose or hexulose) kinase
MSATPVIAIFDVGKTNKKLFLFDEHYRIVFEKSAKFTQTVDEDGFPCENLESLRRSVFDSLKQVSKLKEFKIKAINFSAYGASFVCIGDDDKPVCPLYNYLKPFPEELSEQFYNGYQGEEKFSVQTASPVLGNLNSGLQLYRLKREKPQIFSKIKYALHLPQYLSFLLTGQYYSEVGSIGCHTGMWDFKKGKYHQWIKKEGIDKKLAPIYPADRTYKAVLYKCDYNVGIGLHDSSAALIPYLVSFIEPFVLISTGTWCISLNPFNQSPLAAEELKNDCLCYMQYKGKPVKASRLFSGYEHEQQVKRINEHFKDEGISYRNIVFDSKINSYLATKFPQNIPFNDRDLSEFENSTQAYHQLIRYLVRLQLDSTMLVLKNSPVKRIFVDGGFSKNSVFMHLLAASFQGIEVFAASMAQASAIGAALVIHKAWNVNPIPKDIIELNYYSG